jgi:hypothetical protein
MVADKDKMGAVENKKSSAVGDEAGAGEAGSNEVGWHEWR